MLGAQLSLALYLSISGASAFMVPAAPRVARAFQLATVDKATPAAFDPLAGENAPLILNNAGKLWVPQRARPRRNRKV
jgi:hypothetical protein